MKIYFPFLPDELRLRTGCGGLELSPPLLQLIKAVLWPNWKLLLAFPELTLASWWEPISPLVNRF